MDEPIVKMIKKENAHDKKQKKNPNRQEHQKLNEKCIFMLASRTLPCDDDKDREICLKIVHTHDSLFLCFISRLVKFVINDCVNCHIMCCLISLMTNIAISIHRKHCGFSHYKKHTRQQQRLKDKKRE